MVVVACNYYNQIGLAFWTTGKQTTYYPSTYSSFLINLSIVSRNVSPIGNSISFIKMLFLRTAEISVMATK